jgi:hypothetical protein
MTIHPIKITFQWGGKSALFHEGELKPPELSVDGNVHVLCPAQPFGQRPLLAKLQLQLPKAN